MTNHYQSLKSSMDSFRGQQADRLKQLSLQAGACEKDLSDRIVEAEHMLKLAEMCRKLETEQVRTSVFVLIGRL